MGLCALFTLGAPMSNAMVAAADAIIVFCALGMVAWIRPDVLTFPMLAIAANFLLIALISEAFELKSVRDLLLIVAFFLLGRVVGDYRLVRKLFFLLAGAALGVGLFELLLPGLFLHVFNVLQFYVMRGEVSEQAASYGDGFFVSGVRNTGRSLLPFLGNHRVSSIFLEPVSMGNFGAIALAFALTLRKRYRKTAWIAGGVAVACIVLADARFAALSGLLFVLGRFVAPRWRLTLLAPAPLIAIAVLMFMGENVAMTGDDLPSRLAVSGATLTELSPAALMGWAPSEVSTVDSGYGYAITSFGLPFCLVLWVAYLMLPEPGPQSSAFKFYVGLYICALLCVSGSSLFALKTAAFVWFALGSFIADEGRPLRERAKIWVRRPAPGAWAPMPARRPVSAYA